MGNLALLMCNIVVKFKLHGIETMLKIYRKTFHILTVLRGACMIFRFVNWTSEAQDTTFGRINATWDQNIIILKGRVRNKIRTILYLFF